MRISDWSSDVCSSDLQLLHQAELLADALPGGRLLGLRQGGIEQRAEGLVQLRGDEVELLLQARTREGAGGGRPAGLGVLVGDRSEERSVGKACVSTVRSRSAPGH